MTNKFILEIAVESVAAAQAAERAGADRVELCADLRSGGVTPTAETMWQARHAVKIPIFAMIRPRAGNFIYSPEEFAAMRNSIAIARDAGMNGVVLGILFGDSTIDIPRSRELVEAARPMETTFHRAFDECKDLPVALEDVILTGATRLLTSGGAPTAAQGAQTLRRLVIRAAQRITILPGAGISPNNFAEIRRETGAAEFHSGLGSVLSYGITDTSPFEQQVRQLVAEKIQKTKS
ncbi:MAG TPA: copper homeostasis protein CutC [Candidatus Acidoferrum sp.]